ncbi:MAG: DUF6152 family protein [Gammaproteobacteria bacterium]|nr:DUF6152 family protein [Gammaproteobacteria bacterium]MDH3508090.1 DUF6152 family protein [Gammaproteobacteria bacterium]
MTMRRKITFLPALAIGLLASGSLSAHHGGAVYDSTRSVTVRGSVTEFKFVFPHTLVYIAVNGPDGETVVWSGELTTPNRLARGIGGGGTPTSIKWTANTLLPGDVVEMAGNPARNGAPSMRILGLVDANGRALIGGDAMPVERGTASEDPLPDGQGADLRGVWMRNYEHRYQNYAFTEEPPPMTPWAQTRFEQSRPTFGPDSVAVAETNDPVYRCEPPGVPRIYAHPAPFEIFQLSDRVVIVYEFQHHVRQIYTDGRGRAEGRPASWMGQAVGHWEDDVLVVETTDFNDNTWIDRRGVPHSDQLRVTERFRREAEDRLVVDITVEDPIAFTAPWTTQRLFDSVNWTLAESVCVDTASFEEFSEFEREVLEYVTDP